MHKRHLVVSAAVVVAAGALAPASAYAGTAANAPQAPAANTTVGSTTTGSTTAGSTTVGNNAAGTNVLGNNAAMRFTSQTVGTLTAVLQFSDSGTKTVQAFGDGSTDTGSTITGYSFTFGDGSAALNSATGTAINHWYSKPGKYTISLTVTDAAGNKATVSGVYTTKGTNYTPYGPTRLLDTRIGTGAPKGAVAAGGTVVLKVGGTGTIPANAQAAVLNLTVTAPTAKGTITAYPDGETEPGTQNVSFASGQTVATLAIVKLGPDGSVDLANNSTGTTQLVADVTGYLTATSAGGYTSLTPARLLDTRFGTGAPKGVVGLGKTVTLTIAGADGGALPATAGTIKAVALNVTVTGTVGGGYITAYPDGTTRPTASNLNFSPGDTLANMVIVPVGSDGKIDLYNYSSGTQLIADVAGYFSAAGSSDYMPVDPARVADTRATGNSPIPGAQAEYVVLDNTAGGNGLAVYMTGFVLTTTVTNTVAGGYLTVYPYGVTRPVVSNLNFSPGQTVANLALATAGQDTTDQGRAVDFYNGSGGNLDLIVDMAGFFDTF